MNNENIPHKSLPKDLEDLIFVSSQAKATRDILTPLAKNEWICFLTSAKTEKWISQRIARARNQLSEWQKRPCCWPGCPHRQKISNKQ